MGDNGAIAAALGNDALAGVVRRIYINIGQRAQQHIAPAQPRVAQRSARQLHAAVATTQQHVALRGQADAGMPVTSAMQGLELRMHETI